MAFALVVALLLVPALTSWFSGLPVQYPWEKEKELSDAQSAEPENPILNNQVSRVLFGNVEDAVVADPSVYGDAMLFATGTDLDHCTHLIRLDPQTGESETVSVPMEGDTIRYPREDADSILYLDARSTGGGVFRLYDKATKKARALCEVTTGAPRFFYEAPYLTWIERTENEKSQLYVLQVNTGDSVNLATFVNSPYGASVPSIRSGQVLYADADPDHEDVSLIRTVLLSDGTRWDFAPGTYVHDPKSAGDRWAWITGDHGENSDLYVSVKGGSPELIARGVIDFSITPSCVVYNRDETVFAYTFLDDKTYVLSQTSHNCQLVAAEGDYAIWRDVTDPSAPVWKYVRVV